MHVVLHDAVRKNCDVLLGRGTRKLLAHHPGDHGIDE
jgi:hypothetical protein